jgi:PadR family transcriptional regulator PadR
MPGVETAAAKLDQELRRGVIVLAILSQLRTPRYGYALRQSLAEQGMPIEEGTLYPLLRRLEGQGLLDSEWRSAEGSMRRRYYRLSASGSALLERLGQDWGALVDIMTRLLDRP